MLCLYYLGIDPQWLENKYVDDKTLEQKLKECHGIYKIEQSAQMESKGKWLLLTERNQVNQVSSGSILRNQFYPKYQQKNFRDFCPSL